MAKRFFLSLFCCAFFLLSAGQVHAAGEAAAVVEGFYAALQETMKQGKALGFNGRYEKLAPAVGKAFDLPLMTRYATGPTWGKMSADDKDRLISAFSRFSIATYASRFPSYNGETFSVLGEKEAPSGVIVETTLTPKGEAPVSLNYLVRKDTKGVLRIADVYLASSISELATRRSEFSAVLKREGIDSLIASLTNKAEAMGHPKDR